jgi:metal iron transporter
LLPFISAPLIYLTCSKKVMRVHVYNIQNDDPAPPANNKPVTVVTSNSDPEVQGVEYINMANGWVTATLGWLIWLVITGLNIYLIVMLALGNS